MKKIKLSVAAILFAGSCLIFSSCIGSFALTNKVMDWNKSVGPKFLNELIFVAFWILPVYEVTGIADLLILNSIEFWDGSNPVSASVKAVDTEQGRYLIACDGKGYTITHQPTGRQTRLDFTQETKTWSVEINGEDFPLVSFIDDSHVKMITPEGDMRIVELSHNGVMAYQEFITNSTNQTLAFK